LISEDSVTDIHRRWYFTLLNPSSYKTSAIISIVSSLAIICINHASFSVTELLIHLILNIVIISVGFVLDLFLLRGTPTNKISKVIHVAAFSNSLWLVTILLGVLANIIFNKNASILSYSIGGLFIASGLRYGIFTSVFGAKMPKSVLISFVMPIILFSNLLPYTNTFILQDYPGALVMGSIIYVVGVIWSILADRAGYPHLKSTFSILQAFLSAWTESKQEKMENIFDSRSKTDKIKTMVVKFESDKDKSVFVILPDVHPGPFNPIGGSDLPHKIFRFYENNAIVLHSVSDHSKNLPTSGEVDKYLESLKSSTFKNTANECSLPLQIKSNDFTLTCINFKTIVIMIISKDTGMEDLPYSIRERIEVCAIELGYPGIMVIDAHNGLGKRIIPQDEEIICNLALEALTKLKQGKNHSFKVGYANSLNSSIKFIELGGAGIGVINFQIDNYDYLVGWSDSNNLVNGLREKILNELNKQGLNMLEVCSSDTHSSSGKRTRQGYYALGNVTTDKDIVCAFEEISQRALSNTKSTPASSSYFEGYSDLKLMGSDQFDNYAKALNKSMTITKVSLGITVALFVIMLYIS
jgi:putative membrane protein